MAGFAILLGQSCKKKSDDPAPVTTPETPVTPVPVKTWNTLNGQPPLVIGHRGYAGLRPDHTLAGYMLAIEKGADFVEPDLVMTKDSFLICRHEPMLSLSTDIKDRPEFAGFKRERSVDGVLYNDWFASDLTMEQIRTLRATQPMGKRSSIFNGIYPIPTFQELIDLVKSQSSIRGRNIGIYPETKHPTFHGDTLGKKFRFTDKVLETLQQNGLNSFDAPVYLQSFEVANLKYARTKSTVKIVQLYDANDVLPNGTMEMVAPYAQPYDFVVAGKSTTYNDMITEAGLAEVKTYSNGIGPWKPYIVPYANGKRIPDVNNLIKRAHDKGLVVHAYTFRKDDNLLSDYNGDFQAELKYFYSLGIDGVFTDFTEEAVAARK